jgi:hypothetical protein
MILRRLLVLSAVALAMSPVAGYAGPCSQDIDLMQSRVDARLEAKAAAGPSARESTAATMHRQPTPGSIAAAEGKLGEVSSDQVKAIEVAMARAPKQTSPTIRAPASKPLQRCSGRSVPDMLPGSACSPLYFVGRRGLDHVCAVRIRLPVRVRRPFNCRAACVGHRRAYALRVTTILRKLPLYGRTEGDCDRCG